MSKHTFPNVWDAIEDTSADAVNMELRSELMMALGEHISAHNWSQMQAARNLGVTQPRISDLLRGKIGLFSLDTLVNMLHAAGLRVKVQVKKAA